MGKMKNALMDWNLENGWDICATPNRKPTLKMLANAKARSDKKINLLKEGAKDEKNNHKR